MATRHLVGVRQDPDGTAVPASTRSVTQHRTRVLIIEDHTLFAESLELALTIRGYDARRVIVAEHATSPSALLARVIRSHPRIVLLDLDLGRLGDGVPLIAPIARSGSDVVVVTACLDKDRWGECIRYGARKVVSKLDPLSDTLATVRRIDSGLPVMEGSERAALLQRWHESMLTRGERRRRLDRLSPREKEILAHLVLGRTVREIAKVSVVSEATVRTQVKSILSKLEVSSQVAAVGLAHTAHWQAPAV